MNDFIPHIALGFILGIIALGIIFLFNSYFGLISFTCGDITIIQTNGIDKEHSKIICNEVSLSLTSD